MSNHTKKTKILFIHSAGEQGAAGKGSYDMVKSLRNSLSGSYEILYPIVSQPHEPSYARWKILLEHEFKKITNDVILIGHSLGGSMLLKYLSEEKTTACIIGLFLVATPQWSHDGWNAEEFSLKHDFANKLPSVANIYFYHCINDPFVPFQHLSFYKKALNKAVFGELQCTDHAFANGLPDLINDILQLMPDDLLRKPIQYGPQKCTSPLNWNYFAKNV